MFKWLMVSIIALGLLLLSLMVLRARMRQPANDFEQELANLTNRAVSRAKQEFATELDFSADSVEKVEAILAKLHAAHQAKAFTEERMADEAALWAAYISATINHRKARRWESDSRVADQKNSPIILGDPNEAFRLLVRERIVHGDTDNVWMAYQTIYHPERFKRVNLEDLKSETSEK